MQVVHGEAHSPGTAGCRSTHFLPWNCLLHLCLPRKVEHDEHDEVCHGGSLGGQWGEGPGSVEAQENNGVGLALELGVGSEAPQGVWAWAYGLQGSR